IFISFFFQAEDGIRDFHVTGVQTCALPIFRSRRRGRPRRRSGGGRREPPDRRARPLVRFLRGGSERAPRAPLPRSGLRPRSGLKIGRASCRERVKMSGGGGSWKRKEEREER